MAPHARILAVAWLAQQAVAAQAAACCACNRPEKKGWLKKANDDGGCMSYTGYASRFAKQWNRRMKNELHKHMKNHFQKNETEERTCAAIEWVAKSMCADERAFSGTAAAYAADCLVDLDGRDLLIEVERDGEQIKGPAKQLGELPRLSKELFEYNYKDQGADQLVTDLTEQFTDRFQELETVKTYRKKTLAKLEEQLGKALPRGASGFDHAWAWTQEKEQEVNKTCSVVLCRMGEKEEAAAAEALKARCTEAVKLPEVQYHLENVSKELHSKRPLLGKGDDSDKCVKTYTYMELANVVLRSSTRTQGAEEAKAETKLLAETILRQKGIPVDKEEDMFPAVKAAMEELCTEGKLNGCSRLGRPMSYPEAETDSKELKKHVQEALEEWQPKLAEMPVEDVKDLLVKGAKNIDQTSSVDEDFDCLKATTIGGLYNQMAGLKLDAVRKNAIEELIREISPECGKNLKEACKTFFEHEAEVEAEAAKAKVAEAAFAEGWKERHTANLLRREPEKFCVEATFKKVCDSAAGAFTIQKEAAKVWKPRAKMLEDDDVKKDLAHLAQMIEQEVKGNFDDKITQQINSVKSWKNANQGESQTQEAIDKEIYGNDRSRRTTAAGHPKHRFLRMLRRAFRLRIPGGA